MDWADAVGGLCRRLENYSEQYTTIRHIAKRIPRGHGNRITEHLDLLFAPGFLNRPAVITDYPGYLRALKIRAERMLNDPARDMQKGEILEEYLDKFYAAWDSVGDITFSDGLYEFWLLLEECRIALFSPELKTTIKSAVASLPAAWQQLRI